MYFKHRCVLDALNLYNFNVKLVSCSKKLRREHSFCVRFFNAVLEKDIADEYVRRLMVYVCVIDYVLQKKILSTRNDLAKGEKRSRKSVF